MTGRVRKSTVWDSVTWRVLRPLAWRLAGLRDRVALARENRSRDIVR